MSALRQDPHLSGRAFAERKVTELCSLGLRAQDAWTMIKIMGPGRAIACYQWINALKQSIEDETVLRTRLNRVARETKSLWNADALEESFRHNKLPAPNGGYKIMMRCLRVAKYLGLISEDIRLRSC